MTLTDAQRAARSASQKKYYHNPENRQKDLARGAVFEAIKTGKLVRQHCEKCGADNAQAHHHDYSKPLDVNWLCHACHCVEHRKSHCKHGHPLEGDNLWISPAGKRYCKKCRRLGVRRHQQRDDVKLARKMKDKAARLAAKIAPEMVAGGETND